MIVEPLPDAPPLPILARSLHTRRGFFFLDTAQPESPGRPGFSFLGFEPFLLWRAHDDRITVTQNDTTATVRAEPLGHLRSLLQRYRSPVPPSLPFGGGAVGYFGYEFATRGEGIRASAPGTEEMPEAQFGFYDGILAGDLATGTVFAVANPVANRPADAILAWLRAALAEAAPAPNPPPPRPGGEPTSNLTRDDYLARVHRIKDCIAAGEVYQVNLAQRFELRTPDDPYAIYERLRRLSPAPFGAYLAAGDFQILSSSPELLLRIDATGRALTRPIKGTRPRGATPAEDLRLAAELPSSEKDRAELLMIVDLARNDLGRVCRYGSVRVDERQRLETHPTVFHLVATISGQLDPARDRFDCLRSLLPGGSITGAPKIRAMQIIDELEPCRRQVYTGSIGYLGFDGRCDLNIAIRTLLCHRGCARYHVGGAIVWDSDPEAEYQETLAKGRALRAALLGEDIP
jgi:para-aminobenzoate synthetase component 1